jgi:hypothetical protein
MNFARVDFWRMKLHSLFVVLGFLALIAIISGFDMRFKPVDVNFSRNSMAPKLDISQPQPICTNAGKVEKIFNKKIHDCNS